MSDGDEGELRCWMLAAIGCALEPRSAVYLSTPITTGRRFVEWRRGTGAELSPGSSAYLRRRAEEVIEPNRSDIAPLVRWLRTRFQDPVIDPTALEAVPGWEQFDYHRFWAEVIERYAHTAVFAEGWQYSSGCVLELAAAVSADATLLRDDLAPLNPKDAVQLIEGAIADVAWDSVLPEGPLGSALEALQERLDDAEPSAVRNAAEL